MIRDSKDLDSKLHTVIKTPLMVSQKVYTKDEERESEETYKSNTYTM